MWMSRTWEFCEIVSLVLFFFFFVAVGIKYVKYLNYCLNIVLVIDYDTCTSANNEIYMGSLAQVHFAHHS